MGDAFAPDRGSFAEERAPGALGAPGAGGVRGIQRCATVPHTTVDLFEVSA